MTIEASPAGGDPAAPISSDPPRAHLSAWGLVALQFGLVVLVVRTFHLESHAVYRVLQVAWLAFVAQFLLPARFRLHVFVLASLVSVPAVLGWQASIWVLGLGLVLLAVCHLPIAVWLRVVVLAGLAVLFGLARMGRAVWPIEIPWAVWPVLGSMFMFRLASYLYALRHREAPFGLVNALSYFFMLPNVSFPLYPVVDYTTWAKSWRRADDLALAHRGVRWMLRGIVHLLLYRIVYYNFALDPARLFGFKDFVQYLLATFLLYLRVSGQFHLIVGLLHLFGFHLPETHKLYFLSSSLTDFWRRINIYWKDFMQKLVFFPSFFALRRRGNTVALVLATLIVFVATWALHAYQWFWLMGSTLLSAPDMLFWGILGVLVAIGTVWESRAKRRTIRRRSGWSLHLGLRRVATFAVLCLLWSLWASETPGEWLGLWSVARPTAIGLAGLVLLIGAGVAVAGWPWGGLDLASATLKREPSGRQLQRAVVLGGILVLALPAVHRVVPDRVAHPLISLGLTGPNAADADRQHRGYYEQLNRGGLASVVRWNEASASPVEWRTLAETDALQGREDALVRELRPGARTRFKGATLAVNRWGMRDRDYDPAKDPGTYRIAVLGPSDVMGAGVENHETFEAVLEERLNSSWPDGGRRFESLNFAVGGYTLLHQLFLLESKVPAFQPDLVLLTAHHTDLISLAVHLRSLAIMQRTIPFPEVAELLNRNEVDLTGDLSEVKRQLLPIEAELMGLLFGRAGVVARTSGRTVGVLLLRMPTDSVADLASIRQAAGRAGLPLIDLTTVYPREREPAYRIAPWDNHPNAKGHQLLAQRMFEELVARRDQFGLRGLP